MAGTFKTFKYGGSVYGNFGPVITQSYLLAQALDYGTVEVTIEAPTRVGNQYALVRSNTGAAEDPSDGFTISSGTVVASLMTVVDSTPATPLTRPNAPYSQQAGSAYYTLFGFADDGAWFKDAATSVVLPTNKKSTRKLVSFLPTMYSSTDGNPYSPPQEDESDLQKFLYAFGLTFDELSSMIDFILPENRNLHVTRGLSEIFVTGVGMPSEYILGVAANARLHREAGFIYRNKGTLRGITTFVEALTGWQSLVTDSTNLMLSLDDGSFERSVGNWSYSPSAVSLTVEPIVELGMQGPIIPTETAEYPFSRMGVAKITLNSSSATLELPAGYNRLLSIPVVAGESYYFDVPCKSAGDDMILEPSVHWLDVRGNLISISSLSGLTTTTSWQSAGGPVIAPEGAVWAALRIKLYGTAGDVAYMDMLAFTNEAVRVRANLFNYPPAATELGAVVLGTPSAGRVLSVRSDMSVHGETSFRANSSTTTPQNLKVSSVGNIDAAAGETFTGSVYVRPSKAATSTVSFTWFNGATQLSVSTSGSVALPANQWTRVHYTVTAPASTTRLVFSVNTPTTFSSTESFNMDSFLVEKASRLGDYFTGITNTKYGERGIYGSFVYSNYEIDYVYRDPATVTVICQPDRLNLVFDPSFELTGTTWAVETGALVTTTEQFVSGTKCGKASGATWAFKSNDIPVVGDYSYSLSSFALSALGTCTASVTWYDYSDAVVSVDEYPFSDLSAAWSRLETAVTSPKNATYAILRFAGTGTVYIDNVLMERADRPQTFFSGDLSDIDNQDGRWSDGTSGSYSLLYNKAPIKLGRVKQTLPYYLPVGVSARVLFWDSPDPQVQSLIPRGIYDL